MLGRQKSKEKHGEDGAQEDRFFSHPIAHVITMPTGMSSYGQSPIHQIQWQTVANHFDAGKKRTK